MNQVDKQKYQLAWFKLSEFVRRGEKERALGIYKLLMHTVDDSAFAKQLEGDLLLFFDDATAPESYITAAQLYKKNGKYAQATAVYEHLVAQFPCHTDFLNTLIDYYLELNHPMRIMLSLTRLLPVLANAQSPPALIQAIENVCVVLESADQVQLYTELIFSLLNDKKNASESINHLVNRTLELISPAEQKEFLKKLDPYR